jgi:hypothetical protein
MIQGKIDFNSPGPSSECYEENAISLRFASFYFRMSIVNSLFKIMTVELGRFYLWSVQCPIVSYSFMYRNFSQ